MAQKLPGPGPGVEDGCRPAHDKPSLVAVTVAAVLRVLTASPGTHPWCSARLPLACSVDQHLPPAPAPPGPAAAR